MGGKAIVQALWVGKRLPLMQQLSIASFLACGHEYHLYSYEELPGVPRGTVCLDASAVLQPSAVVRDPGEKGYSGFSNVFRYQLLLQKGGWWVDTDQVCLCPFDFASEYVFSSEHTREGLTLPNTGAIRCPAGSAIMQHMVDVCSGKDLRRIEWGEIGPSLISRTIPEFGLGHHVQDPEVFCPVPWFRFQSLLEPNGIGKLPERSVAVHLWNAVWHRQNRNPDAAFHPQSAYEGWKLQFLGGDR